MSTRHSRLLHNSNSLRCIMPTNNAQNRAGLWIWQGERVPYRRNYQQGLAPMSPFGECKYRAGQELSPCAAVPQGCPVQPQGSSRAWVLDTYVGLNGHVDTSRIVPISANLPSASNARTISTSTLLLVAAAVGDCQMDALSMLDTKLMRAAVPNREVVRRAYRNDRPSIVAPVCPSDFRWHTA